jgi:hypothetical protein
VKGRALLYLVGAALVLYAIYWYLSRLRRVAAAAGEAVAQGSTALSHTVLPPSDKIDVKTVVTNPVGSAVSSALDQAAYYFGRTFPSLVP